MSSQNFIRSPLSRWVGGKYQHLFLLRSLIPTSTTRIIEPFCGSAVFSLNHYERNIVLNDSNKEVINFFKVLKDDPEELINLLYLYQKLHSEEFYNTVRQEFAYKHRTHYCRWDIIDACRFFYLHHTCFNGLYRVNRFGYFNVPIGKTSKNQMRQFTVNEANLIECSQRLCYITLTDWDFREVLNLSNRHLSLSSNDLIMLDPPYVNTFSGYTDKAFGETDHKDLCNTVLQLATKEIKFILFNSDNELYKVLLKDFTVLNLARKGTISSNPNTRGKQREILITNLDLPNS